uniref:BTAD domain-containing putative transcriptional regulator n=1 Tax=Streptomyces zhihengii TaxID=1818004 RepID=UPI001FD2CD74|nr:BTAD domain-containing putative transcriptional regulator [Streptomyces zhihengii]
MRFGVLGPLVVWDDGGTAVTVPETKVRALLATLLAHDGGPVSADRLVRHLWGDDPPGKPAGALQAKVSQLRRVLGRDNVTHEPAGYRLRLDPDARQVDADRFRALANEARTAADPHARAALLTEALGLWRGPAYADFADEPFVRGAAGRLDEQRLSVTEEQAEARLAVGDHLLLAGELAALVERHPLRERLRAAQIRALYLTGRQSEALASYEHLRTRLADDLGVDPGPSLTALHQAVLRQDPALTTPPPGASPESASGAWPPAGSAAVRPAAPEVGRPAPVRPPGGDGQAADAFPGTHGAVTPEEGSPAGAVPPGGTGAPTGAVVPEVGSPSGGWPPTARAAAPEAGPPVGVRPDAAPQAAPGAGPSAPGAVPPDAAPPSGGWPPAGSGVYPGTPGAAVPSAPSAAAPEVGRPAGVRPPGGDGQAADAFPGAPGAAAPGAAPPGEGWPQATPVSVPPRAATPVASNLPVPLTGLVGRDEALAEVSRLLDGARLVTLTGAGGVGKTRLAVAAAAARVAAGGDGELPDGVWLVEFAGVRAGGAGDLAQVVSATLGIRDGAPAALPGSAAGCAGAPSPAHRLAAALRDRRVLLVLDNCEHVVDAAAELAALILRTAPGLRVLATSQEPLDLAGEAVHVVEPLGPDAAVRLFTERAAARDPGFGRTGTGDGDADREAVAEICRRLDGIPLALELAATRVRALGVRGLAARLGDRFRVLTTGGRGAPARQQTLRAVIDWSWELLSAPERIVLRRLAVHSDGCDLEAAEATCAGDGVTRDEVLDLVTRLVDRSLVVVVDGPTGRRYRLLESVAAYATERLHEMADVTAVAGRHLRHYLALAEHAEPLLRGPDQRHLLARLDAEAANLRAALDEAVRRAAAGDEGEAVRLATALSWWWLLRGRLIEAHRALTAVLAASATAPGPGATTPAPDPELVLLHTAFALLTGDHTGTARAALADTNAPSDTDPDRPPGTADADAVSDPVRRGRALWLCAYGRFSAGEPGAADRLNDRALGLFTAAGDRWGTAAALGLRATLALVRGDLAGLSRDGVRGAALFRELGDRWGELQTVTPLAALAEIRGDYEDAARRQREGLGMARELGLLAEVSARLSGLGRLALLSRDWERGRELHEQARRIAAEQGYKYGEIHSEMGLALGARRSGDLDAAEAHLARIRDGYADVSSEAGDHLLLAELGFLAELRGDAGTAAAHHLRGLAVARSLGEPRALALSLEGLAGAAALGGGAPGRGARPCCSARPTRRAGASAPRCPRPNAGTSTVPPPRPAPPWAARRSRRPTGTERR